MSYISVAARLASSILGTARARAGSSSAMAMRPSSMPMPVSQQAQTNADAVQQFDRQRITQGSVAKAPGGQPAPASESAGQKAAGIALNPVAGAQEVTGGVAADTRAVNFNQRLTGIQEVKTQREQEAKRKAEEAARAAAAEGAGGGGGVGVPQPPTGPVGQGRQGVIDLASTYLGSPYVLGGNSYAGIDCSGLVQQVYRQFGFNFPRLAADQAAVAGMRTNINNLRPGDLVAWADGSHIAIYAGNGQVIQALNPGQGTIRSHLSEQTNQNYYGVALRFAGE